MENRVSHRQSDRRQSRRAKLLHLGKITEHFIPYLPDFAYNPKDARFLGSPIDFIVFDGLNDGEVKGIVFVEVKTGSSALSTRERRIKDAVQSGRVAWLELRPQLETESVIEDREEGQSTAGGECPEQAATTPPKATRELTASDRLRLILKDDPPSSGRA